MENSPHYFVRLFIRRVSVGAYFLYCVFFLLFSQVCSAETTGNVSVEQDVMLVWAAEYDQGEQIYCSSYEESGWTIPLQLSNSTDLVYQPVISFGNDGKIWAVWTRQGSTGSFLEFSVYSSFRWSQPHRIDTGMDNNKAAALIVDVDNTPWIAWTGIDKRYPDIFWSRWNGQRWNIPAKAHAENNIPDLHPSLALDDSGHVVLSWQTLSKGKYVPVSRIWNERQWKKNFHDTENNVLRKSVQGQKGLPPIPKFIQEPWKATLFIKRKKGAQSLSVSLLLQS
jgi:hypothetical protein